MTDPTAGDRPEKLQTVLKAEFDPAVLPRSLSATALVFIIEAIMAISLTALVFRGPVADLLPLGIVFALAGEAVLMVVTALLSSYPGAISVEQDSPAIILALSVPVAAAAMPAAATALQIHSTILVLLLGITILTGLVFLVFGIFRLGGFVRYLPYPVLGGFLAGTGWLLVQGGVGVMADLAQGWTLFSPAQLIYWLPGFAAGIGLFFARRRWKGPLTLVAGFVVPIVLFYAVVLLAGTPFKTISAGGWLLGPFPEQAAWQIPAQVIRFSEVHWPAVFAALPTALPAVFIAMVALLLNASSLELVVREDLDLNRDLVAAGAGNLLSGFFGGLIGYTAISTSALNHELARGKRLPAFLVAGLLLLTIAFGSDLLSYLPRMALGALVVYIGFGLLYEWVVEVWARFPRIDAAIVMAILVTIALTNFLAGIGVGMALTIVLFLVNYSRIDVVRYRLTGDTYQSRFKRGLEDARLLEMHAGKVSIFKLEGFIFFGTANNLYEQVHAHVVAERPIPIEYLILDFERVSGMDSTGLLSFEKMVQDTRARGIHLILTHLTGRVRDQLEAGGMLTEIEGVRVFQDLDRSMEWCEDQLILSNSSIRARERDLVRQLRAIIPETEELAEMLRLMTRRDYAEGEYLMKTGDAPDEIMLIERGQVSVQLEEPGKEPVRLETTGGGRIVGELGFYLDKPRTAHVIADTDTTVYVLHRDDLERIKETQPEVLHTLARIVINQTSERIVTMTRVVETLR